MATNKLLNMNSVRLNVTNVPLSESLACLPLKKPILLQKQLNDIINSCHTNLIVQECTALSVAHIDILFEIIKKYEESNTLCVSLACRILATILDAGKKDDFNSFFWKDFTVIERIFRLSLTKDFNSYCLIILNSVIANKRVKLETFCGIGYSYCGKISLKFRTSNVMEFIYWISRLADNFLRKKTILRPTIMSVISLLSSIVVSSRVENTLQSRCFLRGSLVSVLDYSLQKFQLESLACSRNTVNVLASLIVLNQHNVGEICRSNLVERIFAVSSTNLNDFAQSAENKPSLALVQRCDDKPLTDTAVMFFSALLYSHGCDVSTKRKVS